MTVTAREIARSTAQEIATAISREFKHTQVKIELRRGESEEDGYLWIKTSSQDEEEIADLWRFAIKACEDAWQEHDVFLVARLRRGES